MIKFEYKILKPFYLIKDEADKFEIKDKVDENERGSRFGKSSVYVDYRIEDEDLVQHPITHKLIKKGYIKLQEQTELKVN